MFNFLKFYTVNKIRNIASGGYGRIEAVPQNK